MTTRPALRLYIPDPLKKGAVLNLTPRQSHYIVNVMRRSPGDVLYLFNNTDGEFSAQITAIQKRIVSLSIETLHREASDQKELCLAFSVLKGERLGILIEKATELGVTSFYPLFSDHTVPSMINIERLEYRSIEAVEQSERLFIPEFHPSQTLDEFLETRSEPYFVCLERSEAPPLLTTLKKHPKTQCILIGPEGGFSSREKDLIKAHSCAEIASLGENILRAETAAIMAISLYMGFHI